MIFWGFGLWALGNKIHNILHLFCAKLICVIRVICCEYLQIFHPATSTQHPEMSNYHQISFIYFTDFHGSEMLHNRLLKQAEKFGVRLLISGGDLCPHKDNPDRFLRKFFRNWLTSAQNSGIQVFGMFGNDDFAAHLYLLDELEAEGIFVRIDNKTVEYQGWKFWGYNFVPELPFGLKDWVKLDYPNAPRPPQLTSPVISSPSGYQFIPDIERFFAERGSIAEDLASVKFTDPQHTIAVTHSPPQGLGLDVTYDGQRVGSRSISEFIQREQPILSLHGHIHESPQVTGKWLVKTGGTTAIQPGPRPVLIEISGGVIQAKLLE